MASIAFAYRSTKKVGTIQIRFVITDRDNYRKSIFAHSKFEVSKEFWDKYQKGTKFSGTNKDLALKLDTFKSEISEYILDNHKSLPKDTSISKDWLNSTIHKYYNPQQVEAENIIPQKLIDYIDYYKEQRAHELSNNAVKKWGVIKNKLLRFEKSKRNSYLIKNVNENFVRELKQYYDKNQYSPNTAQRELGYIKQLCFHARKKGVETSPEFEDLSIKGEPTTKIYLTFDELKKIQDLELSEHLDNARDWLIISCFTAQRISDFMRFNKTMLTTKGNTPLIEFKQVKTGKLTVVPVLPEVEAVLNKRDGEFPKPLAHQYYNRLIKEVCKKAELNTPCRGKVRICIAPEKAKPNKNDYRDVIGTFDKWQLVSSHIGRRSMATNFYGKISTSYLIQITNHSSEAQFLNYIQKSKDDFAHDAYNQFANVKR